ncbi:hypothetical protein [Denitromonas sp.]|uniref:hypothetical protein n=1 Tax=Denitromonas sp. TaxID=2734609 RepID=UPI002AFF3236|nr:hypothetical protein [Denitromonas sp.]
MQPQNTAAASKQSLIVRGLTLIALVLMIGAYFSPTWWVALTAPNYPEDAFPDGIRIHFSFTGVENGCSTAPKTSRLMTETFQEDLGSQKERYNPILEAQKKKQSDINKNAEALDCVHEMNTINHYVGMHPIGIGAPVERQVSRYVFGFFGVMLLGFAMAKRKARLTVLGIGFAAVTAWMIGELFVMGKMEAYAQYYMEEAGAFFNEPERIAQWGSTLKSVTTGVAAGLIAAMAVVWVGVWKIRGFSLLLAFVPALLPIFFVIDYAGWLWFFGHNLHPWGAFTVKPFMPTVFGVGKVAQFSTYSYPYWGYLLVVIMSLCLLLATLIRRKQMREGTAE